MEREKLNKVASDSIPAHAPDALYDEGFIDGFIACADWLMQQPISERLTEEEKGKIKTLYNEYHAHIFHIELEGIFGSDLFKEK